MTIFPNVPKVTRLQKLRCMFDFFWCIFKFSTTKKLQGFRSYEGYAGLLLTIFPNVPKVMRLQKLRCIFKIFRTKVTRFQKLQRFRRALVRDFPSCLQSYEVIKVTVHFQIFKTKSKVTRFQKLQRLCRASADSIVPKVTGLQKLQCFFKKC